MSHTWFAGPEARQPLGVLHWDPANGEIEAQCATHVYQVLLRPLFPGWQRAGGGSSQLRDAAGKTWILACASRRSSGHSSLLEVPLPLCRQLRIPRLPISRMPSTSIKIPLRK